MITQEIAKQIFIAYQEIEQANKMITELKESLNEKGDFEISDNWGNTRGLELHIPTSMSGAKIKRIPVDIAFKCAEAHIELQQKELERLKTVCLIQLK